MHTPDLDGEQHRRASAAQRIDLTIFGIVVFGGAALFFWVIPWVADWMKK